MGFRIDAGNLLSSLETVQYKSQLAIKMYATEGAKKFQNYAKTHKRWINRTGHAQQRLTGYVETKGDKTNVCIAHGVDYGIYLELDHERRYAILEETVQQCGTEVLEGFSNLMSKL